jgi:3-deoxy-D-manno-octulosonic-acid transferase
MDLPAVVRKVVRRLDPRLIVLLELELWPAFLRVADELGVPQVVLNGRITEGSFRSYRRLRWWLPEYDRLALVAAQDEDNRLRFTRLGVPEARTVVTGSLKHDLVAAPDAAAVAALRRELGLPPAGQGGLPVFLAGSTHEGEDEPAVAAWRAAGGGGAAHMLLVPRHLERLKDIQRLLRRLDVPWELRSAARPDRPPGTLLLVDSMGELESLFGLADVVFLGGSLVPVGGHNVLEPAAAGCALLVGPHLESCRREADLLAGAGALQVVPDGAALCARLATLLADAGERARRGRAGAEAAGRLRGAAQADVALLRAGGWLER